MADTFSGATRATGEMDGGASQYNMVLSHRSSRKHGNADSLSRMCTDEGLCEAFVSGVRLEDLPCGSFIDEVDGESL